MGLSPFVSQLDSGNPYGDTATETFVVPTHGQRAMVLVVDVTAIGTGKSYVTSAAVALPLTITAGSNDQFEYNELEYLIPAGTYTTAAALATAVTAATNDEDNVGAAFNTLVLVTAEPGAPTKLRFTSVATGVNTLAFGTGAEHDGLAGLGITDGWTIAHTEAAGADNAYSQTVSILGVDPVSGKTWTILAGVAMSTVTTQILQVSPDMVAVNNLVANSLLPATVNVQITHTTNNSVTRTVGLQLVS